MTISFDFLPDPQRARVLDARMRTQLTDSLEYLGDAVREQLGQTVDGLDACLGAMRRGEAYPPSTFGLYYELGGALISEDYPTANALWQELLAERPIPAEGVRVLTLDDIPSEAIRARYQRLMDTDPDTHFHIVSPPPERAPAAMATFVSGMRRLKESIPSLSGEFEALIREVILVVGDKSLDYDFAGGSSYMLWGALFINAESYASDIGIIEAIAHESAHSLLFGHTIDEPLVLNDDRELFVSPLRDDPRPMDGIYHATYVTARMCWTMNELLRSATLNPEEAEFARQRRATDSRSFWSGYATILESAKLSATGQALLQGAHDYMRECCPAE